MIVTTKISMDLSNSALQSAIDVMQNDTYSRDLQIALLAGTAAIDLSQVTGVLIRYHKPDGTCGAYDTMPDGSCAWSIAGNAVTVRLAPQVCTAPGRVQLTVTLLLDEAQLSCFTLCLQVQPLPQGRMESRNYSAVTAWLPQPSTAAVGQYLVVKGVDGAGKIAALETADISVIDGEDGATFIPFMDASGNLSWSNNKGLSNPATVNLKGENGAVGPQGVPGIQGEKGDKGDTGAQGVQGPAGARGADGATPVKGTDYFTAEDKAEMVEAVVAALPQYAGEVL